MKAWKVRYKGGEQLDEMVTAQWQCTCSAGRRSQLQFLTFQAGLEKLSLTCQGSLTHWMRWTDGLIVQSRGPQTF